MKKIYFIIVCFFIIFNSYSDVSDDFIADELSKSLIESYDENYKGRKFLEVLVLKIGKPTFIDSVLSWRKNYKEIPNIKVKLHPEIEKILTISEKYLTPERLAYHRDLFEKLTLLAYRNLQIYYKSVKEYFKYNEYEKINAMLVEKTINQPIYYDEKIKLYQEEDQLKQEIRLMFKEGKLKYALSFYSFAFDFFDKIRVAIIKRDMEKMLQKIKEKETINKTEDLNSLCTKLEISAN
ncbi:MAG: hypothetical protein A2086_08165 [Spirochaetes bacterium GWD1_27_9]|nr:MAG: hypothetical protein A2086_08165 [Spirochaetes bacterium GWD1_27_9]